MESEDMKLQRMLSLVRQAVEKYHMIEAGDRVAVGVSGGKDSMALLYVLKELSRFYPKAFTVCAVSVDLGFEGMDDTRIRRFCEQIKVELSVVHTKIGRIVMEEREESNPCSLCAKMRKGALVQEVLRLGCNKIAYAHHMDDFVETMLLSMMFQGRFYAFLPVTWFEDTELTVLRPMMFVEESQVKGFCRKYEIPVAKNPCPADGTTSREYAKRLLAQIQKEHPGVKNRMFHAILTGNIEDWPEYSK